MSRIELDRVVVRAATPGGPAPEVTVLRETTLELTEQRIALIAGFAALIAVCALLPDIKTGVGVPYSLQTFGVLLTGAVLGPVRGFLSVTLYLVAGLVLPIYSGGS